jgi:hypothetical protein
VDPQHWPLDAPVGANMVRTEQRMTSPAAEHLTCVRVQTHDHVLLPAGKASAMISTKAAPPPFSEQLQAQEV